jgi:hypothetical protein
VVGLASDTAAAALQVAKGPLDALAFLEEGRGILATSLEDMRRDISDLRNSHPGLVEQFDCLRDELKPRGEWLYQIHYQIYRRQKLALIFRLVIFRFTVFSSPLNVCTCLDCIDLLFQST